MKRSQMVEGMAEYWLGLFPGRPFDEDNLGEIFHDVKENMDRLLSFMEHKGMKPPVEDVCPVLFNSKFVWEKEND